MDHHKCLLQSNMCQQRLTCCVPSFIVSRLSIAAKIHSVPGKRNCTWHNAGETRVVIQAPRDTFRGYYKFVGGEMCPPLTRELIPVVSCGLCLLRSFLQCSQHPCELKTTDTVLPASEKHDEQRTSFYYLSPG